MGRERQRQHEHIAVDMASRKCQQTGDRDRHDEKIDQHEIGREQPGGAANFGLAMVLDDGDMKLPRQQHNREQRQCRHRAESRQWRHAGEYRGGGCLIKRTRKKVKRTVKHDEGDEDAHGKKCHELDDRLRRNRKHQAVLMLGSVSVAGAEQHRKGRHEQRDKQRAVADHGLPRRHFSQDSAD